MYNAGIGKWQCNARLIGDPTLSWINLQMTVCGLTCDVASYVKSLFNHDFYLAAGEELNIIIIRQ